MTSYSVGELVLGCDRGDPFFYEAEIVSNKARNGKAGFWLSYKHFNSRQVIKIPRFIPENETANRMKKMTDKAYKVAKAEYQKQLEAGKKDGIAKKRKAASDFKTQKDEIPTSKKKRIAQNSTSSSSGPALKVPKANKAVKPRKAQKILNNRANGTSTFEKKDEEKKKVVAKAKIAPKKPEATGAQKIVAPKKVATKKPETPGVQKLYYERKNSGKNSAVVKKRSTAALTDSEEGTPYKKKQKRAQSITLSLPKKACERPPSSENSSESDLVILVHS